MLKNFQSDIDMQTTLIQECTVNPLLNSIGEDVMGFLNEIQLKYPAATSFASGRPDEHYFDIQHFPDYFNVFVEATATAGNKKKEEVMNHLGQYNRAKGIINEHIARYLEKDEAIKVNAADILVTVGTQEALVIALLTLCDRSKDVIIVEEPTYVGITHLAMINGYEMGSVAVDADGISLEFLEEKIIWYKKQGRKAKVVYVTPDYQNPTGNSMSLEKRHRLLELAHKHDFFILEDNAYGDFIYQGVKHPALKALDKHKKVIYLRSFSKTLYPSLRLGVMVVDQVIHEEGKAIALSDLMAKTKGYVTVNTPAVIQAVLGGMLIKHNYSLKRINKEKIANIKRKRNQLLLAMNRSLNVKVAPWAREISWNQPAGGFFLTISVPFQVDKNDVIACVEAYNVIFTPMSFFYLQDGGSNEIRLAFSYLSYDDIAPAVERLAMYFKSKICINK
jgi:(S)-3,5-dihydroxyphenylglycine transaminase